MNLLETYSEYQRLAKRTMKEDSRERLILHCTMGMVGEAGELLQLSPANPDKQEQRIGEVGDCCFYAANLFEVLGRSLDEAMVELEQVDTRYIQEDMPVRYLVIYAAELSEEVKKAMFYGKNVPDSVLYNLTTCYVAALVEEARRISVPLLEVMSRNIAKLEARYPGLKFNPEHAIHRDYDAESKSAGIIIE